MGVSMCDFCNIGIEPTGTLADTAHLLGEVLGGLVFVEDSLGRYDEFPAFVAESAGLRFALLGIPDPEDDLRDDPTEDYELLIEPIALHSIDAVGDPEEDISEQIMQKILNDGRIRCWSLK